MEIVPRVSYEVDWHSPTTVQIGANRINSDAARSRMIDVAHALIDHALSSSEGVSSVTITVKRIAKKPTRVRIVGELSLGADTREG